MRMIFPWLVSLLVDCVTPAQDAQEIPVKTVTTDEPEIVIDSPNNGDEFLDWQPIQIKATVTDEDSSMAELFVSLQDEDGFELMGTRPNEDGSAVFDLTGLLLPGDVSFNLFVTDELGFSDTADTWFSVLLDEDRDESPVAEDCDDTDPLAYPGATEICDDIDNNCNSVVDEGLLQTFYLDNDNDGFGDSTLSTDACEAPSGYVTLDGDCDDTDPFVYPGALELCGDGIDQNCDGDPGENVTGAVPLATADATFNGEEIMDGAGFSVSGAGDVNADGFDDVVIGAPYSGVDGEGTAYVVYGSRAGNIDLSSADALIRGEMWGNLGTAVAGVGDVNNDGYADILVGEPKHTANDRAGEVYLFHGPVGANDASTADATFIGESADNRAGTILSAAGDVNGDGYADILIGTLNYGAYLLYGPFSGEIDLADADIKFIFNPGDIPVLLSVSGAGDVNGDGFDDVIIGNLGYNNMQSAAHLYLGPIALGVYTPSNADATYTGERRLDHAGISVAGVGDVNNDGYDDILIGADHFGETFDTRWTGKSYLVYGSTTPTSDSLANADASFLGESLLTETGRTVAGAGDINGDGFDDILIGSERFFGDYTGKAYLMYGGALLGDYDLSMADVSYAGENINGRFSYGLSSAGDYNADGYDDIIMSAYGFSLAYPRNGTSYLFFGGCE